MLVLLKLVAVIISSRLKACVEIDQRFCILFELTSFLSLSSECVKTIHLFDLMWEQAGFFVILFVTISSDCNTRLASYDKLASCFLK